jgi:hypothetical protein
MTGFSFQQAYSRATRSQSGGEGWKQALQLHVERLEAAGPDKLPGQLRHCFPLAFWKTFV